MKRTQVLTKHECTDYGWYEIHHPNKDLLLCKGNKWLQDCVKALTFTTKEEANKYLGGVRRTGKVMQVYNVDTIKANGFTSEVCKRPAS